VTFTYQESLIPAEAAEENLVIATWEDGKWLELENSTVDPDSNTITAPVSHFTVFTIMAHTAPAAFEISAFDISPAVIYPGESVTISATITNTGELAGTHKVTLMINEGVTAIEEVSLAGHESQQLNFTLKPQNAGSYTVNVNELSATFIVREALAETSEEAQPTPSEAQPTQPEATSAPSEAQPTPSEASVVISEVQPIAPEVPAAPPAVPPTPSTTPAEPAPLQTNFWLIISIVAGGIVIGIIIWRLVASRGTS
jgi:hypothetical protein